MSINKIKKKNDTNFNKNQILTKILSSSFFKHQRLIDDFHIKWLDKKSWEQVIDGYESFLNESKKKEIVPRIIHQIWLGSKIPKKYFIWRKSWMDQNPGFKYVLWDEKKILKTGLINEEKFLKTKNFGVKSDIARYEILYKFGGIYVDIDFEALKPIETKLLTRSFVAGQLFDYKPQINNALIMSEPKSNFLNAAIYSLGEYHEDMTPHEVMSYSGPYYLSKLALKNLNSTDILILPSQYFYPWPHFMKHDNNNPHSWKTNITIAIHHWEASWIKKSLLERLSIKLKKIILKK